MILVYGITAVLSCIVFLVLVFLVLRMDYQSRIRFQFLFPRDESPGLKDIKLRIRDFLADISPPRAFFEMVSKLDIQVADLELDRREFTTAWWVLIMLGTSLSIILLVLESLTGSLTKICLLIIPLSVSLPAVAVRQKIRVRKREIRRTLPDFLDLITLCVEAGLGFENALDRVSMIYPGVLGKEFRLVIQEIILGYSRKEALENLAARTPSKEIQYFVEAVSLADKLGTSISRTMRIQVKLLRNRRRQIAETKAQTAPIRIIPALVFFFLPGLLLIYLAPPILNFLLR